MPVIRSHNYQMREAYFAALSGIDYDGNVIKVYADMAPDDAGNMYITFAPLTNVDASPKTGANIESTMLVSVYHRASKYVNAQAVDAIANEVLQRITAGITIDTVQNVSTEVVNDNTERVRISNQLAALDRLITFRHKIFQGT